MTTAEDRQGVLDTLVRCADAFDRRDWGLLDEVFTDDAEAYGTTGGREAVVAGVRSYLGGCGPSQHLLGNHRVEVEGNDATSACKARVFHVGADRPDVTYECFGTYHDQLVRTADGWRIRHRHFEVTISLGDLSVLQPG